MAHEPSYPKDAPVGEPVGDSTSPDPSGEQADADVAAEGQAEEPNRTRQIVAGAAIGIGSAALVAALLYANRSRKGTEAKPQMHPDPSD